jgi:hypothetical protein
MRKKIPEFHSEEEEFEFWSKADSTEYPRLVESGTSEATEIDAHHARD